MIDPVFPLLTSVAFALLFGVASWHKARDLRQTAHTIRGYRLVPDPWATVLAPGIATLEVTIAACLLFPATRPVAAFSVAGLLLFYATVMHLALKRGAQEADCGCSFGANAQLLSLALVGRNIFLAGLALTATLPALPRTIGALDFATVAFALMAAALLYAACNTLIKNKSAWSQL